MRRGMGSLLRDVPLGLGILTFIVGVGVDPSGSVAQTAESGAPKFFANNEGAYSGGRGLITASGPTGMFLNPTSGTLSKGAISAQVFGSIIKPISNLPNGGQDQFPYYNGLLGYGVTDWLEVGGLVQVVDRSNNADQQTVAPGAAMRGCGCSRTRGSFLRSAWAACSSRVTRCSIAAHFLQHSPSVWPSVTTDFSGDSVSTSADVTTGRRTSRSWGLRIGRHWPSEETALLSAIWVQSWNFRNISFSSVRFNPGKPAINVSPSRSVCNSVILRVSGSVWLCSAQACRKA
jgi:hypothetical protein